MKKLISLALAIVMIMSLSITAFAETVKAPGDYTADVTGNYASGNESNGIVYCVDIDWGDLNFTYHAEKGAVWNPETLKYSDVADAYWEGEGTITVTNSSNTKISAVPEYTPADGYDDAGMDFSTEKLKVASAESGTAPSGTITVTPNGFLPAMDGSDTIGTITLTIAQDTDVTVEEAEALVATATSLMNEWESKGVEIDRDYMNVKDNTITVKHNITEFQNGTCEQEILNYVYKQLLNACNTLSARLEELS